MLLTDDEILSASQDHFAKIANVRDNDVDWDKWANEFARAVQSGVAGFGDSPALAMWDFDVQWNTKIEGRPA